ncbi:MFS transporter [uncultured Methanobrevibacter sp.]|uniref:MFS transporter n=1 Tax=uncultured Methanobrevibacter sp. TaxID=253161 RepID=UPI0025F95163|nr:MFS transporter [uncultured Methanobrevibacter sp.]
MTVNSEKNTTALIIFVIAAALLSTAQTVVTTGVVGIMADFHVSSTLAEWVYSSFLLVLGVMIPISAYIARRYKIRSILNISLLIFLIGTVVAFLAPNMIVLILGRVIQGIGAGIPFQ